MLLEVKHLTVRYESAMILNNVSLEVGEKESVGVLGPNGAGKSTLLRAITGLVRWQREVMRGTKRGNVTMEGEIRFEGKRIDGLLPHQIVRMGLIHCPERRRIFREMTVLENLKTGAYFYKDQKKIEENLKKVYELFPILKERRNQVAGTLSGGEQQMLAVGRALMSRPKLLCIDEPSLGLAPKMKKNLIEGIKEIQRTGVRILIAEQDASFAFNLTSRNYVLSQGKVVVAGSKEKLLKNETIRKSYLGL
ncbi:MAG: ABC transporter ATP-binding protein [Candidatus Hadarchaeales archaeon]